MAPPTATTKKWIDKKNASTFQVRHRSQEDPLIHDDTATPFVLFEVDAPNANKGSSSSKAGGARDLAAELGIDASTVRANEGEAAMYGIYYDDTQYDYMQHMRDIGTSGEAIFIDAQAAGSKQRKDKKKNKQSLDQAIMMEMEPKSKLVHIPKELLPSETVVRRTYQDMQDIPDAIAGFQPDMDPRLREVLEALEDEAYVDDDEDIFAEMVKGGEADEDDFFDHDFEEEGEDNGWESDTTEKAVVRPSTAASAATAPSAVTDPSASSTPTPSGEEKAAEGEEAAKGNADWMREFSKFKKAQKKEKAKLEDDGASSLADTMSFGGSSVMTAGTVSVSGRRRRRREKKNGGAKTATSGYSMSSSALFRTEGLTLLDDRFDKIEEEYNNDSDDEEQMTGPVPETRKDFDAIMDEFLGSYTMTGARPKTHRVRRGKYQTGLDQLDEIRRDLATARLS